MVHNELDVETSFHELPEADPNFDIVESRWRHGFILEDNFTKLHELVDLYGLVVVIVQLQTNFSDVLHIS